MQLLSAAQTRSVGLNASPFPLLSGGASVIILLSERRWMSCVRRAPRYSPVMEAIMNWIINNFELLNALGSRNQLKAYQIVQYFAENQKANPLVVTTATVFGFFVKILKYHGLKDKNPKNVASVLGVSPYFLKDYDIALKNYPMRKVSQIVATMRELDVKSKGVGVNALPHSDLLREMVFKIFN